MFDYVQKKTNDKRTNRATGGVATGGGKSEKKEKSKNLRPI